MRKTLIFCKIVLAFLLGPLYAVKAAAKSLLASLAPVSWVVRTLVILVAALFGLLSFQGGEEAGETVSIVRFPVGGVGT